MKKRKALNKQTNKPKTLLEYKAEKVVRLLEEQISDISNVQSWAKKAGVSRRWLCKSMKAVYGKSPKIILREMKYEKVVTLIRKEGIEASCYCVAVDAGFGEAKKVSMFLSVHYGTNFSELKRKLIQEEVKFDFLWLRNTIK